MTVGELRVVATAAEVHAAADVLGLRPAALASALLDPAVRLLADGRRHVGLLRREWAGDGVAEAVLVHRLRVGIGQPAVVACARDWGCERIRDDTGDDAVTVPTPANGAPLADRFRHHAALAATRVEVAVALARDEGRDRTKPDGSPSLGADEAAHLAAAAALRPLDVTLLSEERVDRPVAEDEPWLVLDPLDGTGNFRAGLPPWAFSVALVEGGAPVAGLVADLSSGRRWFGVAGAGAWRDGVPARPRPGTTVVVPTAPAGGSITVPDTARRVRVTGCTAVELCLVADGSAAAWHDLDRAGTHVHDVAGGLAVLAAAGGVALDANGAPLRLRPDTEQLIRLVAAADRPTAEQLLAAAG